MKHNEKDGRRPPADPNYDIGYGRPPTRFQFKKGVSGNPSGRPSKHGKAKTPDVAAKDVSPKGRRLTDEELLQIVKERKLSLDALRNAYGEEPTDGEVNTNPRRRPPR